MSPKLSLEELVCGELTLKTEEKYDEIIRVEINRMFGGSSKMPLGKAFPLYETYILIRENITSLQQKSKQISERDNYRW